MNLEDVQPGDKKFRDWMRRYREEIGGEAPPDEWLDTYLQVLFKDQGKTRHIWYAVDRGRTVGFAIASLQRSMADGHSQGMIAEFFVYPEYRREGYGRRIAQAVIEFLKDRGAAEVYAAVVAGNVRGLRFWEACGFQLARYSLVYRPEARRDEDEEAAEAI
jgi:GNAT superfamily N-acetyltransferase